MATKQFDDPMQGVIETLVAETADVEIGYSSGSADNTYIQTAEANVPYPKLQHTGMFWWIITGEYFQPATTQTIDVQLVIDGVAVSLSMLFVNAAGFFAGSGTITIDVKVIPLAQSFGNKENRLSIVGEVTITDGAGQVFNGKAATSVFNGVDVNASHKMRLQIRKTLATANHFLTLHSQNCFRIGGKSGS